MESAMTPDTAQRWLDLAAGYGPTFFSMLFLLVISRWSYKNYDRAVQRKDPAPDATEKSTLQRTFLASFVVGILLTGASLVWFFFYKPKLYVFTGEIEELQQYERLNSDKVYLRSRPLAQLAPDDPPLRNEEFAVVSSEPFVQGQIFRLFFKKNDSDRNSLDLVYDPNDKVRQFKVDLDTTSGKLQLVRLAQSDTVVGKRTASLFGLLAYAQQPSTSLPAGRGASKKQAQARSPLSSQDSDSAGASKQVAEINVLQNPVSNVGSKIAALDYLNQLDAKTLDGYLGFRSDPNGEPFAATLIDLTRHSDKEVAFAATRLARKADVDHYVKEKIVSSDAQKRNAAQRTLYHYDQARAAGIVQSVKSTSQQTNVDWKNQAMIPTTFPDGDRYYLQVSWDPGQSSQVNCVARFLSQELDASRSLNDELALLKGRKQRLLYSVDKGWVSSAALKLAQCGARVAFVRPSAKAQ